MTEEKRQEEQYVAPPPYHAPHLDEACSTCGWGPDAQLLTRLDCWSPNTQEDIEQALVLVVRHLHDWAPPTTGGEAYAVQQLVSRTVNRALIPRLWERSQEDARVNNPDCSWCASTSPTRPTCPVDTDCGRFSCSRPEGHPGDHVDCVQVHHNRLKWSS